MDPYAKQKSKSQSHLLNKQQVQVIRSHNYGSIHQSDLNVFGASPSPPTPPHHLASSVSNLDLNIKHNLNLSNIPRNYSEPILPGTDPTTPSKSNKLTLKQVMEYTIHSPYLRTLSPHVGSVSIRADSVTLPQPSSTGTFAITDISAMDLKSQLSTMDLKGKPIAVRTVQKVGVWGAGFSIINLFLGLGLLSFPYALAQGSFVSIAVLALTCFLMSYTGKLIVRCFEGVPIEDRTYHQVGFIALDRTFKIGNKQMKWGNFGMGLVTFGILCEFIGALCMSTIFIWDNFSYLVPEWEQYWIVLIASIAILPTCWMLNVSELAFNAFLGCICKIFTVAVIVANFFTDMSVTKREHYDYVPQSSTSFSISMGIFILSYAGHACLPEVYTSMEEPEKFEHVLDICFVIMFVTYSGMALFGYLQYGALTNVIVTENLIGGEQSEVKIIVAKTLIGLVIASCYFQVSPILSVVAAIPEDFCNINTPYKKRIFRTFLFAVIIGLSWSVMAHLAILEAATGSLCTMITSVICPALFYFGLNYKTISWTEAIILMCYLFGGIVLGIFLLYNDIISVVMGQQ